MQTMKKPVFRILAIIVICAIVGGLVPSVQADAAAVKISEKKKTMKVGESFTLTLKNAKGKVTWKSSDKSVATVKKGVVTAAGEGKAKITAKNNGKKYTCKITVKPSGKTAVKYKLKVLNTGLQADEVFITGEYATIIDYKDCPDPQEGREWPEQVLSLVSSKGKVLISEKFHDSDDVGLKPEDLTFLEGYYILDNGMIMSGGKGFYNSDFRKVFELNLLHDRESYVSELSSFDGGMAKVRLYNENEDIRFVGTYYDVLTDESGKVLASTPTYIDFDGKKCYNWFTDPREGVSLNIIETDEENGLYVLNRIIVEGKEIEVRDEKGGFYDYGWDFSNGLAPVCNHVENSTIMPNSVGFIDKTGKLVIPCQYTFFDYFRDGTAIVGKTDKKGNLHYGVINTKGKEIIPLVYDECEWSREEAFVFCKDGLWCAFDNEGNQLLPLEYDSISPCKNGKFTVRKGDEYGVVDLTGSMLIPLTEENIISDPGPECAVISYKSDSDESESGLFGVVSYSGETLVPFEYDDYSIGGELVMLSKDGKWGAFDNEGNTVIPVEYDALSEETPGGIVYAIRDREMCVITWSK